MSAPYNQYSQDYNQQYTAYGQPQYNQYSSSYPQNSYPQQNYSYNQPYSNSNSSKKENNDLIVSIVIFILGFFFFRLLLLVNLLYIKSEDKTARIVAYISLFIFLLDVLIGLSVGVFGCCGIVLYVFIIIIAAIGSSARRVN